MSSPTPSRRGMSGSARSMLISMAIVLALCFAFVALVPRMKEGSPAGQQVDMTKAASTAAADAPWEVSVPLSLPPDWKARSSKFGIATDDLKTWHMGYEAPTGQYVALEESQKVTDDWLEGCAGKPTGEASYSIRGETWVLYEDETKNHKALVREKGDLTTVVSGSASYDVLAEFAASLRPHAKASSSAAS